MARTTAWETHMRRAAEQLSRACAETAAHMSGDETAVREIKELAGAIKELSALNASLKSAARQRTAPCRWRLTQAATHGGNKKNRDGACRPCF